MGGGGDSPKFSRAVRVEGCGLIPSAEEKTKGGGREYKHYLHLDIFVWFLTAGAQQAANSTARGILIGKRILNESGQALESIRKQIFSWVPWSRRVRSADSEVSHYLNQLMT